MFAANSLQNQINWGDQLQKTNLRIGASTEALSQYNYVASLSGVEFNQLTTAWQRQTRRIAEAAAGTGVAVAALDRLNLSAQELNQLAPEDQFERIAEAMQGVENSSERVRLAQQLWDSEGVKLVQIVNSGTDAIAAMRAEADALGLTISQDTANAMASYNDEVDRLKFAAQGVSQTLLSELVPAITAGLQNVNAFIQEVGGAEVVVGHLTDGAQVLAALLAGRYAGAFATATAAKLAATQQSIAYQMALARMAGVSTTVVASQTALAASVRGVSGALTLVGGPAGAAVIAVGSLFYFREELGFVDAAAKNATIALDDNSAAIRDGSAAALDATYDNLINSLEAVSLQAQEAMAQLTELEARQAFYENSHQGMADSVSGAVDQQTEALADLWARQVELQTAIRKNREAREQATSADRAGAQALEDIVVTADAASASTNTAAAASRDAAKQTTTLANSYENLLDRIQPNRRAARQYAQDVGTLNLALATGRINAVQYMQAMGMLQESFQAAQREAENTATASEDASQRIANSFLSWETVADNTLRRIDDSGQSLWLGLIDGSESALDTVKRGFQQTLAEIAHMLTTQRLTFHVAGMMGLDTAGMPGGGGGGFNLSSLGSLYTGATNLPYIGDAISSAGSALGFGGSSAAAGGLYANALTGSAAAGGLYAGASTGAAVGGLYGNALTGAATTASGGFMSAASAAMPWLAGGALVDNVLGLGIVDGIVGGISGLFGGRKTAPKFELATVGQDVDPTRHGLFENYGEGVYSRGALGTVGFYDPNTARLEETFDGFDNAKAFLDGITALDNALVGAAANLDNGAEKTQAMASAAQAVRLNASDAAGIANQLATRTLAVVDVIDGDFSAALRGLGLDAEQITGRVVQAANAMQLLDSNSARLNLQFDASAEGALNAAAGLSDYVGGLDNIAAVNQAYYNAAFTETERLSNAQLDLYSSLSNVTDEVPTTVAGLRTLVEAQDLNTEAGGQLAYQLMQLAPALRETNAAVRQAIEQAYQSELGRAPDTAGLEYWFDRVASGSLTLDGALWNIANSAEAASVAAIGGADAMRERTQLELQLLRVQGNANALRDYELSQLAESNRPLQERIWAIEDERAAMQEAERAQQERIRALEQEARTMMSAGQNIRQFVESLQNTGGAGVSPETAYQNAEESFLAAISTIYTSDDSALVQDTISGITGIAQQYLNAAEAYGASGNIYQQAQALVEGSLDDLASRLGSDELEDIDPQLQAMVDQLKNVATNTGLAGPLAKQVPLAQTFAEFFGGSGNQNYMVRQIGALAEIEKAIRNLEFSSGGGSDIDTSPSQPAGKTLTRSQVTSLVDASDNFSFLKQTMRGDSSQRAFSRSLAGDFNSGSLAPSVARNNVDKLISAVGFDEANYLRLNPDIAEAIGRGEVYSGFQHFLLHGIDEGRKFAKGGVFTNSIVSSPTLFDMGLMGESGDEAIMPLTRHSNGSLGVRAELPPMPQFPLLGKSDVTQVMRDMQRTIEQQGKTIERLLNDSNTHLAAANNQRGAAATQQIAATKEGNKMLKKLEDDARLEAAKR
jgi:hypothetical protein